jgi:hypothetical protein
MAETDNPLVIEAIAPSWQSSKIHLHVEGYRPRGRPGRKPKERCLKVSPMCGVFAPSTAVRVPLREALHWPKWTPQATGEPFPVPPVPERRWCVACLGHAADLLGLTENLVRGLAWELEIRSSHPINVQGQSVTPKEQNSSSDGMVRSETGDGTLRVENV